MTRNAWKNYVTTIRIIKKLFINQFSCNVACLNSTTHCMFAFERGSGEIIVRFSEDFLPDKPLWKNANE